MAYSTGHLLSDSQGLLAHSLVDDSQHEVGGQDFEVGVAGGPLGLKAGAAEHAHILLELGMLED